MIELNSLVVGKCNNCRMSTIKIPGWVRLEDMPAGVTVKQHVCVKTVFRQGLDYLKKKLVA